MRNQAKRVGSAHGRARAGRRIPRRGRSPAGARPAPLEALESRTLLAAVSINVDFNATAAQSPSSPTYTMTAQGAFQTPDAHLWNGVIAYNATETPALFASDGTSTPVTVTVRSQATFVDLDHQFGDPVFPSSFVDARPLLDDYIPVEFTNPFTINHLTPGDTYDLYLYGVAGASGHATLFTVGDVTRVLTGADHTTFVEGANYARFTNVVADANGTIPGLYGNGGGGFGEGDFNGLQIVPHAALPTTDRPPTATFTGGTVVQGDDGSVAFTNQSDPSPDHPSPTYTYSYDFDNNGTFEIADTPTASAAVPAAFLAAPGTHTVHGRIIGQSGLFTDYTTTITVTPRPTAAAAFVSTDAATQGNWKGTYGGDGHAVFGDQTTLPAYATLDTTGIPAYTWAPSTTDPRALQKAAAPADRLASTLYAQVMNLDLNVTGDQSRRVALYLLDWDLGNRSTTLDVIDVDTGVVLASQSVNQFTGGKYLLFDVRGHVTLRLTNTGGPNAVVAGVFFGPGGTTTPANHAPALGASPATLPSVAFNDTSNIGSTVAALVASLAITDPDAGALKGVAITAADTVHGAWQFSTDSGATWQPLGAASPAQARLLADAAANRVRFVPATDYTGPATLTLRAWDQTTGTNGGLGDTTAGGSTAFSPTAATATVTVNPAAPAGSNAATFVSTDAATQGNWKGVYGADGAAVFGDQANLPAYAQLNTTGIAAWTWLSSTTDPRALQKTVGPDRLASTLYAQVMNLDLHLTDGQLHRVALYVLDWDLGSRAANVEILDATTGALLAAQGVNQFTGGKYLVFDIRGHVTLRITNLAGPNAVLEGLFFDPAGPPPANHAPTLASTTATLPAVAFNHTTNSGSAVAALIASLSIGDTDPAALRGIAISAADQANGIWQYSTDSGATWLPFGPVAPSDALLLTDAPANRVRFVPATDYAGPASFTLRAWDRTTGANANYADASTTGGETAFSATTATASLEVSPTAPTGPAATYVSTDATTGGTWQGTYGADGYWLFGGQKNLPPDADVHTSGISSWTWAESTADPRALQKPAPPGDRLAATVYGQQFSLQLQFTGDQPHRVSLYLIDWDSFARTTGVEVIDPATGQVLAGQTVDHFHDGKYVTFDVRGRVTLRFTNLAGINAVLAGIFFDPVP